MSGLGLLRGRVAVLGAAIVALLGTGTWVALTHTSAHASGTSAAAAHHPASVAAKTVPLKVLSVTPAAHATDVNGAAPISVTFSAPLAADSPMPKISPRIGGRWQPGSGNVLQFIPAAGFRQLTQVRVRIPAGSQGVRSATGVLLSKSVTVRFRTGTFSARRLDQLLAQLNYLPLTWTPASQAETTSSLSARASQLSSAYDPPAGSFRWKHGYPSELKTFWHHGSSSSLIIDGAVRAFEFDHGLLMDGIAGPEVWKDLFAAAGADQRNTHGYTYAIASEHDPETLTIWHDGRKVLHSLANTGIPGRTTVPGTFPVYLRYLNTIMKGKNPNGTKYADPVKFVSYFNGGDAVHYFLRGSYGFPQSLGCVELPYTAAQRAWPYLTYGSLVTVTTP